MKIRHHENGTVWIPRRCNETIKMLDEEYDRIPGTLTWRPRIDCTPRMPFSAVAKVFKEHCYIVGKGLSTDSLTADHFDKGSPIVCVNEAVFAIEKLKLPNPVFGIRQDHAHISILPEDAIMLIPPVLTSMYAKYEHVVVFNAKKDLGFKRPQVTMIAALRLAKVVGCEKVTMYGFDATTSGDLRYSKYQNKRNMNSTNEQLLTQKNALSLVTEGLDITWMNRDLEPCQMGPKSQSEEVPLQKPQKDTIKTSPTPTSTTQSPSSATSE